jgi:hypothetical protein
MARGFKKEKKNKFDALPQDFKDAVDTMSLDELKTRLSDVAKAEEENQSEMKADEPLNQLKEQVKVASSGYREVSKLNKLKRLYTIQNLADKGDPVAQSIVQNNINAESQKARG